MNPSSQLPILQDLDQLNLLSLQNVSGSIDDVIYNLANVKLAMAGDKRNEVIKMLTSLLEEAVEVRTELMVI